MIGEDFRANLSPATASRRLEYFSALLLATQAQAALAQARGADPERAPPSEYFLERMLRAQVDFAKAQIDAAKATNAGGATE